MTPLKFLFALHNHQPVGNFGHVFEELFDKCYKPYFDVLEDFPGLKTTAHFSGPLLEWIREHRPEFLRRLRALAQAGQLEILSGGFYEPLLSLLPHDDAVGQIRMMNDFIREELGAEPRGLWLAERIWTPALPAILHEAEIEFTLLDDTHFNYAGLREDQLDGYYVTEHLGAPLSVFPISKFMRYAVPFKQPQEILDYFGRMREQFGFRGIAYGDDGEKFGGWPDTYDWVYKQNWLRNFFSALEANAHWVQTASFAEYIDQHPPTGRVYLPMASYEEMMEWALPTQTALEFGALKKELADKGVAEERSRIFLRGGQWNNFMTKYSESNNLHKKMLYVSRKVEKLRRLQPTQSDDAVRELYRGQCNCAQWHGLFGGLYLNYLRHALYQSLIAAECLADEEMQTGEAIEFSLRILDFDLDGRQEYLAENQNMNAYVAPAYGGTLFEFDYRPARFNITNVLRRREEPYHQRLRETVEDGGKGDEPKSIHDRATAKEEGLENLLIYDRYERRTFMDHFLGAGTTPESFEQNTYEEAGDFVEAEYEVKSPLQPGRDGRLVMERRGVVKSGSAGRQNPVRVEKVFRFAPNDARVDVDYKISLEGEGELDVLFGVEFNLTLLAGDAPDRYYISGGKALADPLLNSRGALADVKLFGLRDEWSGFEINLGFSRAAGLWRYPIESVSQSEDGFERTYQGSCLLAHWPLTLRANQPAEFTLRLDCSPQGQ